MNASPSAAGELLAALVRAVPPSEQLPESVETAVLRWLRRCPDDGATSVVLLELASRQLLSTDMRDVLGRCHQVSVKAAWLSRSDHPEGYVAGQIAKEKRAKVLASVIRSQDVSDELLQVAANDSRLSVHEALLSRSELPDDVLVSALVRTVVSPRTYRLRHLVSEWTSRRPDLVPQVVSRLSDAREKVRLFCQFRGHFRPEEVSVLLEKTVAPALSAHLAKAGVADSGRYSYWNMPETALWYHAESEVLFAVATAPGWVPSDTPKLLAVFHEMGKTAGWSPKMNPSPVNRLLSMARSRITPTAEELSIAEAVVFGSLEELDGLLSDRSGSVANRTQWLASSQDVSELVEALRDVAPGRPANVEVVAAVLGNPALSLEQFAEHEMVQSDQNWAAWAVSFETSQAIVEMLWRRWREDPVSASKLLLRFDGSLTERLRDMKVFSDPQYAVLADSLMQAVKELVVSAGSVSQLSWSRRQLVTDVVHLAGGSVYAAELLSVLPFTDLRWVLELGDSAQLAEAAAALLAKVADDEQWETLLGLSETFQGSLSDLVDLSAAV